MLSVALSQNSRGRPACRSAACITRETHMTQRQVIDPTAEAPGLLTSDLDGYVSSATRQDFITRRVCAPQVYV